MKEAPDGRLAWLSRVAPYVGLVLISILLVGLHVKAYTKVSPIDELQHIDYLYKIATGHVVRNGELVGAQAMNEEACRGIDAPVTIPACGSSYAPSQFQEEGFNTANAHPPVYYAITAVLARLLTAAHVVGNFVTAGRLVGAFWLAGGLIVFWKIAQLLGATVPARASVAALLASTPAIMHAHATVNPDASSLIAGGLVLLVGLLWEDRRSSPWLLLAIGALAVLLKATNLIGVLAVVLYLGIRGLAHVRKAGVAPREPRAYLVAAAALGLTAIVAEAGWLLIRSLIAVPNHAVDPMSLRFHVGGLSIAQLTTQIVAFATPVHDPYLPSFFHRWYILIALQLFNGVLLAASLGAILYATRFLRIDSLAGSASVVMGIGAPLLVVGTYLAQQAYTTIPARYGLSLLPLLGAILAASLRTRWTLAPVGGLAAFSVIATVYALHPL